MIPAKCVICDKSFDRQKISCVKIGNRYAHEKCTLANPKKTKELFDREDFFACVKIIYVWIYLVWNDKKFTMVLFCK